MPAILLVVASLSAAVTAAHADDKAGCKDPSWAPDRMPAFAISDCGEKAWAALDVDTADSTKHIEGERSTVTYRVTDESKAPSNAALRKFFVDEGQKAGAKLLTDPDGGWTAVLTKPSPDGDIWDIYTHGDGNEDVTEGFTLTTVTIKPLVQDLAVQDSSDPLPANSATCKNPPWLAKAADNFKIDSCNGRPFDRLTLSLRDGDKIIQGHVYAVSYSIVDDSKPPVALALQRNFSAALQKLGAKVVSDPSRSSEVVATRTTPQGEFWYQYRQGSGNEDEVGAYTVTTLEVAPEPQEVVVRDTPTPLEAGKPGAPCADPPWLVKQFAIFKIDRCDYRDVDQITIDMPDGQQKIIAGRILDTSYALADEHKVGVTFLMHDNYVTALQGIGAQLVNDPNDMTKAVLTRTTPAGDYWYLYAHTSGNDQETASYTLTTIQIGGPPPKACTLEVYGVNFDFDKSDLRPESEPVLRQLLAIFNTDPAYAAEVGGHTDNVGQKAYNMSLSARRADAVKAWLVANGVAPNRMTTAGYGDTRPLVPNDSDDHRFKNRRVELKRDNCKS